MVGMEAEMKQFTVEENQSIDSIRRGLDQDNLQLFNELVSRWRSERAAVSLAKRMLGQMTKALATEASRSYSRSVLKILEGKYDHDGE